MNCALEGNGIKAFGKAIYALSRIADELWLDPMVKGLALRSVNSSQTAYACFFFSPMFFHTYSLASEQTIKPIRCKLAMKSLLPLFRCSITNERNVERCQISVDTPNDRVMIQFFCRHGITKTHNLCYQESAPLQAVFDSHLCANVLQGPARLLANMVMHFQRSQEEVTLSITPLRVSLRNYHEGRNDHMKMMYTEMSLHPDEFDFFQSGGDTAITFCLKELRALLTFAESLYLLVSVQFGAAGKPLCFSVENPVLEATVVLATLNDYDSGGPSRPTNTLEPTISRCTDAAARDNPSSPGAVMEVVPSSQGSPTDRPDSHLLLYNSKLLEVCTIDMTGSSPASSMICSLLFQASPSKQDENCAASVLVCESEMEMDEDLE
ncbi:cell cycle checkpoint control protein RAD9B [Corythoichthys intestinalis]|uniref:cell cycle checkpoint control protein RAD9B n=1 Tax=Corythoichthys intestinalis TaxID=161448 RepID=UPI0025A5E2F8|nr:cell cycle checkpoint control protein RAD9B [Corythoichthys intestinalis]XP_061804183.1 cell cycle checkpoint control protein RAD9B-like [Nerophis lumbriciformis]